MASSWYVVQVYSGSEKRISQQIIETTRKNGLDNCIDQILIPSESVSEMRRGRRVFQEQKLYPGYILIRMVMTDDLWHLIRNTPKVTGLLGNKTKPIPITEVEAERIIRRAEGVVLPRKGINDFLVGEHVRVIDGPFSSFQGTVEDADAVKERIKVSVSIFGRYTPVDLDYSQVEKII
jgi:transcriptional antiterminator NusG